MQYQINKLTDIDTKLCDKLKRYCYEVNGCCQTVHRELGPFLNEYMYQDALEIILKEQNIPYEREYYFSIDFLVKDKMIVECKAVETLNSDHRQQLWNYMRLTKTRIGILWNFAPTKDQSEHYYLNTENNAMYMF